MQTSSTLNYLYNWSLCTENATLGTETNCRLMDYEGFFYLNENLICYEWFIIAYAKRSVPEITI